jgi:hypothetical protein
MVAVGWGKSVLVAGGVALAGFGLLGIFWGGSVGPGVAKAQMGGMGGGVFGGMGGGFPAPEAGPVVTVRLAGEQPAPQPGEAKFFSPLSDPPKPLGLLDNPGQADFQDVPLGDAVKALAEQATVEVQIDQMGLEEVGMTPDAPVTLQSSNMTLADALDAILSPMGLTYVAKERYVLITTKDRASEMTETRMYAIADHPLLRTADGNALVNAITGHVDPGSWSVNGMGYGSVSLLPGVLIVTNNQRTLDQVEDFLAQYGRLLAKYQPADDPAGAMMGMGPGMEGGMYGMPSGEASRPMRGVFGTARNPAAAGGGGFMGGGLIGGEFGGVGGGAGGGGEGYEGPSEDEPADGAEGGAAAEPDAAEEGTADPTVPGGATKPLRSGGGLGAGGFQ